MRRLKAAMTEEGVRIQEEGIAGKASDIDLVMSHGYVFPRWRGGPMHHAERTGLADVMARIEAPRAAAPLSPGIPDPLRHAVESGRGLDDTVG